MNLKLGILGRNISYSLSPKIFEWGFRQTGIQGEYRIYDYEASAAIELLKSESWDGLNVTVPYKTIAFRSCQGLAERAQRTGSVNALKHDGSRLWGDNTDVAGFRFALEHALDTPREVERILITGNGGAARSVAEVIREVFPHAFVHVAGRDPAPEVSAAESNWFLHCQFETCEQAAWELDRFDLIVQCTPVGGQQVPGVPLPGELRFKPRALVFDLIYAPRKTAFLQAAEACSARTENGLVMLIAQAAASFRIWTGTPFPLELALTELLPELQHL
jgi:shikimate dehydrogenase